MVWYMVASYIVAAAKVQNGSSILTLLQSCMHSISIEDGLRI